MTDRKAYIEKAQARLAQYDAEIDKLKAKMDEVQADAKVAYRTALEDAQTKRREVQDKLDEMKVASEGAWDDLSRGLETAWDDLSDSVQKAADRFR